MTSEPTILDTASGTVEGRMGDDGIGRWFGIPFAAPPTGDRRWRPPEPVEPWTGVRSALDFGADCPQPAAASRAPGTDEDCLFLNVWSPGTGRRAHRAGDPAGPAGGDGPAAGAPVMVWFYGGSFLFGSGADPVFDGAALARRGVVVVTANYRVGLFGYLAHPDLRAESPHHSAGNYGLLDMVAALDWVRANIGSFGGDPANVTAFGVSAGSASLSLLLTSPLAAGRFDRLILESPGSFRPLATLEEAEAAAVDAFGPSIEPWRACPADDLLAETGRLAPKVRRLMAARVLRPIADGWVVPGDERRAYATGAIHRVPVLVGGNLDEGSKLTVGWPVDTVAAWHELLALEFGPQAGAAAQLYPAGTDAQVPAALGALFGDTQFALGARGIARSVAATGAPAWRYLFTRRRPGTADGPHHGEEVPYVFGTLDTGAGGGPVGGAAVIPPDPADRRLSEMMQGAWVRFATTGDPNLGARGDDPRPAWPPVDGTGDPYLVLDSEPHIGSHHRQPQLDFLDQLTTD